MLLHSPVSHLLAHLRRLLEFAECDYLDGALIRLFHYGNIVYLSRMINKDFIINYRFIDVY